MSDNRNAAVITVSDRCSRHERIDTTGPAVEAWLQEHGWSICARVLVPDEQAEIEAVLRDLCAVKVALVLTAGGTGLGPRDVTPEATRSVLEREVPGIGEVMRQGGAQFTPLAALSRALCGTCQQTLIVNLPGSPKGAVQSLQSVHALLPHAVDVLRAHQFDHGE